MVAFEELRSALVSVRIAHHIRGRVRFKLGPVPAGLEAHARTAKRFDAVLVRVPGVHAVRANLLARSCTVDYDVEVIPMEAWADFLAGTESAAAAILECILRDTYRDICHAKL